MLVGATYGVVKYGQVGVTLYIRKETIPFHNVLTLSLLGYATLGFIQMLYPIGGLIADICCGRYKIIRFSLFKIWLGFLFGVILGISYAIKGSQATSNILIVESIGGSFTILMFMLGFSGFQANILQFGLDQMLDASSEKLSLFLHWFVWTEHVGELLAQLLSTLSLCSFIGQGIVRKIIGFFVVLFLLASTVHLIMAYWKRQWFHCEKTTANPYRNVCRVLKYAAKHNKPVSYRSALTYSDDEKPPRIDFAKQKYGGPYTTQVVEDVKTFLRILVMLVTVTIMFYLDIPTVYLFPIFGLHLGESVTNYTCTHKWVLFQSGNLSTIISIVSIPMYLLLIYPFIKKWVPCIISRLGCGIILKVLSVGTMFVLQVVATHQSHNHNNSTCLFLSEYRNGEYPMSPTLQFPVEFLLVLNFLNGIAIPLINITAFEFISAQSPQAMKGLLLGIFYAFRGLFAALSCILTLPFTQERLWGNTHGTLNCGFYFYLMNVVLGATGLFVFLIVARWYRYRERDDPPYGYHYVENYYSRYVNQSTTSYSAKPLTDNNQSCVPYGTI